MTRLEKKDFTKLFFTTALPIAFQSLLQNSLSFIDTLMIGKLGETSIAAVGICSQVFFLVSIFLYGISSGSGIFFNQFWGAKDKEGIHKSLGLAIVCGEVISFVFSFLSVFTPQLIMRCFVDDVFVSDLGCTYLRWVGFSYMFTAFNMVLSELLRAVGKAKTPMQTTLVSMITDIIFNYILIFVCNLGVAGAAIATAFSRMLETCLLLIFLKKAPIEIHLSNLFVFEKKFVSSFFSVSLPVIVDDGLWALGMTVYKVVHAHMGVDVLAAANVVGSISDLFFVLTNGFATATMVLLGNEIGRGNPDRAYEEGKICIILGIICGLFMTVLMAISSPFFPKLFSLSETVYTLTATSLFWFSFLMPVKSLNLVNTVGALRAGGDTKFVFYLEIVSVWFVGVPLAFLSGLKWGLPLYFVLLITNLEEVFKISISLPRFFSKKWIHVLTDK